LPKLASSALQSTTELGRTSSSAANMAIPDYWHSAQRLATSADGGWILMSISYGL
jgi:hypothetical protein